MPTSVQTTVVVISGLKPAIEMKDFRTFISGFGIPASPPLVGAGRRGYHFGSPSLAGATANAGLESCGNRLLTDGCHPTSGAWYHSHGHMVQSCRAPKQDDIKGCCVYCTGTVHEAGSCPAKPEDMKCADCPKDLGCRSGTTSCPVFRELLRAAEKVSLGTWRGGRLPGMGSD